MMNKNTDKTTYYYAVIDDICIYGIGTTPEKAKQDSKQFIDVEEETSTKTKLKTVKISESLYNYILKHGGGIDAMKLFNEEQTEIKLIELRNKHETIILNGFIMIVEEHIPIDDTAELILCQSHDEYFKTACVHYSDGYIMILKDSEQGRPEKPEEIHNYEWILNNSNIPCIILNGMPRVLM